MTNALAAGTALDIGCGTGDNSIYLAKHGWQVTGVDFVARAVDKARAKASANNLDIKFAQADATRLSSEGVGTNFDLIVDNGCLHGMSDEDRDAYVREVTAVAAPECAAAARRVHPRRVVRRAGDRSRPKSSDGSRPTGRCCRRAANRQWTTTARIPARYYLFARAS